jgi:hypothetical protein
MKKRENDIYGGIHSKPREASRGFTFNNRVF